MRRKSGADLAAIDAPAMLEAIDEFDRGGRLKFLDRYGISRSSKFYLIHNERLYDTKALVAAAHWYATSRRVGSTNFTGGPRTIAVFNRVMKDSPFARSRTFKDAFGELRNLSTEFDRIPHNPETFRQLGFSRWIPFGAYFKLNTKCLPGAYIVASAPGTPTKMRITDPRVINIGETVSRDLGTRLKEFDYAIQGRGGHSCGDRLYRLGCGRDGLWLCVRSFPLAFGDDTTAAALRATQVRYLERLLLLHYVKANGRYPLGNYR